MTNRTFLQPIVLTKIDLGSGWTLNCLSERIATITDPQGRRRTTYFGFFSQEEALTFQRELLRLSECSAAIVRSRTHLSTPYECKCWDCSTELILALIERLASPKAIAPSIF